MVSDKDVRARRGVGTGAEGDGTARLCGSCARECKQDARCVVVSCRPYVRAAGAAGGAA